MGKRQNRYKTMERYVTYALIADGAAFVLYLLFAGFGFGAGKIIMAILAFLISGLCLVFLYLTQELLRRRSLWMSVSAAAVLLCLLVSLITNYPSPDPLKNPKQDNDAGSTGDTTGNKDSGGDALYFDTQFGI